LPDLERETSEQYRSRLVALLVHYLFTRDISNHPEVMVASAEIEEPDGSRFRALARVSPEPEAVRMWWSHSTTRAFNDPGNAPWLPVEMVRDGDFWTSPWVDLPPGEMIGWYVEAETSLDWEGLQFAQRDASPQRFFNEFPPMTCSVSLPDCPPVSPTGLKAVPGPGRVDLDWNDSDGDDLHGYEVNRSFTRDGEFVRISGETPLSESEFVDSAVESGKTYQYYVTAVDIWGRVSLPTPTLETSTPVVFRRGDCNDDGTADISDAVCILGWLFLGEEEPGCVAVTNTNGDEKADLSDAVYLLGHLFLGGPAPVVPFPECGPMPGDEELGCDVMPANCQ